MLKNNQLSGFGAGGGFLPNMLSGLEFWFRSDLLVTGSSPVTAWGDLSTQGRNLAEATNGPSVQSAVLDGRDALRFDGSNDMLNCGSVVIAQPMHLFLVGKSITFTTADRFYQMGASSATTPGLLQRTSPNVVLQSNGLDGASVNADTTAYHLFSALFNGVNSTLRLDNGVPATSGSNLTGATTDIRLANLNSSNYGNVDILEFFGYSGEKTGADLTAIENYIAELYPSLW